MSQQPVSYRSIRHQLNTGDIVLFSGKGNISQGIKWLTCSKWSHIGMVVRIDEWDKLVLYESTTLSDLTDIERGTATKGVQMVFLSDRLRTYGGEVAVRHLNGVERTIGMREVLKEFRAQMRGRPYERSKLELFKAAYDGAFGKNEEDLSSLFCSELVAEAYQCLGILDEGKPSNEFTPADFSDLRNGRLQLLRGQLSPEIQIRRE